MHKNNSTVAAMSDMVARCTSCGECVRPCAFLQAEGMPAAIARRGDSDSNLLVAYSCSLCGLCDAVCPERLSPSDMFRAMRQEAVKRRTIDLKPYSPWLTYEKLGGSLLFHRDIIPEGCSTVFFPGCSFPGTRPDGVVKLLQKLRTIDPTIGLVLDCCGKISQDLGLTERFEAIFNKLSGRLKTKGITRIITSCPGCSKTLREHGEEFETTSIYEILAEAETVVVLRPDAPVVTVHDPCPARFDDAQQQAVRQMAHSCGYRVEEMPGHGRTTRCCGQGGMVEGCVPGSITREAGQIAAEADGRTVISSCAACIDTLGTRTAALHLVDLIGSRGNMPVPASPPSSAQRWMNRLFLRVRPLMMALFLLAGAVRGAAAQDLPVSSFAGDGLKGWESKSFKGTTDYRIVQEDGHTVLKAHAKGAASGLTKKITFNPAVYRYLKWRWKVAGTVAGGNESTKGGDDYAARTYVIFPGRFFWQMRALNYIWANRLPKGEFIPNAYTGNAMMIAVESGPSKANEWVYEERDILADYRRVFGEDPPVASGIAIMTDTDNTGGEATAWYGDITLSTVR
jgi:Fe-S oxidoreductase